MERVEMVDLLVSWLEMVADPRVIWCLIVAMYVTLLC